MKEGKDATVVVYGRPVLTVKKVAEELAAENIDIEVIDLRSLYPYDWQAIKESVKKTKRVMFVNEDTEVTNFAEHLVYRCNQELFYDLYARPKVCAGINVPGIGLHPNLEDATVPDHNRIMAEVRELLSDAP